VHAHAYRSSSSLLFPSRFLASSSSSSSTNLFTPSSSSVSFYHSQCPPRLLLRARGAPLLNVSGFLRYRESFRVRLRATDYRNQATPGSGISTANYNHRFFSYVTSLFSCRFVSAAPRMYDQMDPRHPAQRESLSFGSLHRDLSVCCAGSEIRCKTTRAETVSSITRLYLIANCHMFNSSKNVFVAIKRLVTTRAIYYYCYLLDSLSLSLIA